MARKLVPRASVIYQGNEAYVFKVVSGEKDQKVATRIVVKPIYEIGGMVAVESEQLADGDLVIVEGNERLRPDTPVLAIPHQPPAAKPNNVSLSEKK